MTHRALSIGIVSFWLVMTALLMWRDVVPRLTAGQPPRVAAESQPAFSPPRNSQAGIFDGKGARIGTSWSTTTRLPEATIIKSTLFLSRIGPIPQPLRVESALNFDEGGKLTNMRIDVFGPVRAAVGAESVGLDFSLKVQAAGIERTIVLDARAAPQLGQTQDPLGLVGELKVGMRWRLHQIDPLSTLMGQKIQPKMVLVEVVAEEKIPVEGRPVDCFRVHIEPNTVAWVDHGGQLVRQEAHLPLLGKAVWQAERYNEDELTKARVEVPAR